MAWEPQFLWEYLYSGLLLHCHSELVHSLDPRGAIALHALMLQDPTPGVLHKHTSHTVINMSVRVPMPMLPWSWLQWSLHECAPHSGSITATQHDKPNATSMINMIKSWIQHQEELLWLQLPLCENETRMTWESFPSLSTITALDNEAFCSFQQCQSQVTEPHKLYYCAINRVKTTTTDAFTSTQKERSSHWK